LAAHLGAFPQSRQGRRGGVFRWFTATFGFAIADLMAALVATIPIAASVPSEGSVLRDQLLRIVMVERTVRFVCG
jgi:hypothetical protein